MALALQVENLAWSFSRGSAPFISIPALAAERGDLLVLRGPSGSGKTSLIHLLSGIERADSGRITWQDRELCSMGEGERDRWRRERVGVVFQDFRLVPELGVLENVLLPGSFDSLLPGRAMEARARELLERVGVTAFGQRAATLSRGEMQRVAIARALVRRPVVLFADEPTASLDAANEAAVFDLLRDLSAEEGITLVVATHQPLFQKAADKLCDLDHGRLVSTRPGKGGP